MAESTPLQFDVPDLVDQKGIDAIVAEIRKIAPAAKIIADLSTKRVIIGALIDSGRAAEAIEAAGFSPKAAA